LDGSAVCVEDDCLPVFPVVVAWRGKWIGSEADEFDHELPPWVRCVPDRTLKAGRKIGVYWE
jgi:hypothetical protein